MIIKKILISVFCLLMVKEGWAVVNADSLQQDSTIVDSQFPDSLELVPQEKPPRPQFQSLWYDSYGNISYQIDSSVQVIYKFSDLLYLNYNGLADIFRNQPLIQVYDHMEMGLPRFVAGFNLTPHQTALQVNGWIVNDPIHGMYNTRFTPTDIVEAVQRTPDRSLPAVPGSGLNNSINISTRQLNPEEPYTRIMFRQGDFGYTDLDITFARQFGDRAALQLSGINKFHDVSSYRGQNYHGILSYRTSRNVQTALRVNINDEDLISYNTSNFPSYKYNERRDEVYLQTVRIRPDDGQMDWKLLGSISSVDRTVQSQTDSFKVNDKYDRYQIAALKNIYFSDRMTLKSSLSGEHTIVWGNAFGEELKDTRAAGWAALPVLLGSGMMITPDINMHYLLEDELKLAPGVSFNFTGNRLAITASAREFYRYPYRNERSIKFYGLTGDEGLDPERLRNVTLQAKYRWNEIFILNAEVRQENIDNEIRLVQNKFVNGGSRSFAVANLSADWSFYKFRVMTGGLHSFANIHLSPQNSVWGQIRYSDLWVQDAVKLDVIAGVNWVGKHNNIYFNPVVQRYYWTDGMSEGYYFYYLKLVATVLDVELYFSVDNPDAREYEYIKGYKQYYRRMQFGLNWVLWD